MSPNSSQTLPQDRFHIQVPSREADANVQTKDTATDCKDDDSTTVPKMVLVKEEFFDVKKEFESESPGSGNGTPAQGSQPSVLESHVPEQSHDAERPMSRRSILIVKTSRIIFIQAPWVDVTNELRSVQQLCGQLRTQVEILETNANTSHSVAGQEALSRSYL